MEIRRHFRFIIVALLIGLGLMGLRLWVSYSQLSAIYLQVIMKSSTYDVAKVYYDLGGGLSEKDSTEVKIIGDQRFHDYRFKIPQGVIGSFRFDPLTNQGSVTITNIEIVSGFGKRIGSVDLRQLRPAHQIKKLDIRDDEVTVITEEKANDPQIFVSWSSPALSGYFSWTFFFFALRMLLEFLAIFCLSVCFFWLWLRRSNWVLRSLLGICLVVAAGSSYYIITKITYEVRNIKQLGSYIFSTTKEQRREIAYRNIGYVYIRDIVKNLPEPEIFPVTRYPDFTKNAHLFLSENRHKIDGRILVGIGLSEEDHKPHPIPAQVNRFKITKHGLIEVTSWSFDTIFDYDDMTGFIIHVKDHIPSNQRLLLNVKIYSSIEASNPLRDCHITLDQPLKYSKIKYNLPESIRYFSFSRGRTAFKIEIAAPVSIDKYIEKIEILAVKVNLSDYTVVHRKNNKFTAIRNDFIKEINSKNLSPWKRYLENLTNGT